MENNQTRPPSLALDSRFIHIKYNTTFMAQSNKYTFSKGHSRVHERYCCPSLRTLGPKGSFLESNGVGGSKKSMHGEMGVVCEERGTSLRKVRRVDGEGQRSLRQSGTASPLNQSPPGRGTVKTPAGGRSPRQWKAGV